jgi:hypothetical protein
MPSRIPSADAQIKNWLSRHCHLLNLSIWTIYLLYKTYTATLKAGQFFMPTLMPCKWSLTRQFLQDDIVICKVAHFANGHLFNLLQLDRFCSLIKLPSFIKSYITGLFPTVYQDFLTFLKPFNLRTFSNTDGLINCLPPTQDSFVTSPKIYESNFCSIY